MYPLARRKLYGRPTTNCANWCGTRKTTNSLNNRALSTWPARYSATNQQFILPHSSSRTHMHIIITKLSDFHIMITHLCIVLLCVEYSGIVSILNVVCTLVIRRAPSDCASYLGREASEVAARASRYILGGKNFDIYTHLSAMRSSTRWALGWLNVSARNSIVIVSASALTTRFDNFLMPVLTSTIFYANFEILHVVKKYRWMRAPQFEFEVFL